MALTPTGERLIVEVAAAEDKTESGLVLPDSAIEPPHTGKVIAVGGKVTEIGVGDEVIFFTNAGLPIKGYDDYRLLDVAQVIAVVS